MTFQRKRSVIHRASFKPDGVGVFLVLDIEMARKQVVNHHLVVAITIGLRFTKGAIAFFNYEEG
jgi:hypothetical protein